MQPLRILDTPVTMRYIKYIVDISRVSVYMCVCVCVYVGVFWMSVRLTFGACVYLLHMLACIHIYVCVYTHTRTRAYTYSLSIPSVCRLSFVYCVALYLSNRPRISLVQVRYLTASTADFLRSPLAYRAFFPPGVNEPSDQSDQLASRAC